MSNPLPVDYMAEPVSLTLEERLLAAQNIIDMELEDLPILRTALNEFNDVVFEHSLILRRVNENFLRE